MQVAVNESALFVLYTGWDIGYPEGLLHSYYADILGVKREALDWRIQTPEGLKEVQGIVREQIVQRYPGIVGFVEKLKTDIGLVGSLDLQQKQIHEKVKQDRGYFPSVLAKMWEDILPDRLGTSIYGVYPQREWKQIWARIQSSEPVAAVASTCPELPVLKVS